LLAAALSWTFGLPAGDVGAPGLERTSPPAVEAPAAGQLEAAFAARRSGLIAQVSGVVAKQLRDDNDGSRHQRFILELASGHTVLVAHNIDLAEPVPIRAGDAVELRGQYEWNERGGVLHWTHHDPAGRHPGGWIRHAGRLYE
jgi:hypothetical protein